MWRCMSAHSANPDPPSDSWSSDDHVTKNTPMKKVYYSWRDVGMSVWSYRHIQLRSSKN